MFVLPLQNLAIVQKIKALADKKGCLPGQLALAWVHAQGEDVFPIPGVLLRATIFGSKGRELCALCIPHAGRLPAARWLSAARAGSCAIPPCSQDVQLQSRVGTAFHEAMASARQAACFQLSASRQLRSVHVLCLGLFLKLGVCPSQSACGQGLDRRDLWHHNWTQAPSASSIWSRTSRPSRSARR